MLWKYNNSDLGKIVDKRMKDKGLFIVAFQI